MGEVRQRDHVEIHVEERYGAWMRRWLLERQHRPPTESVKDLRRLSLRGLSVRVVRLRSLCAWVGVAAGVLAVGACGSVSTAPAGDVETRAASQSDPLESFSSAELSEATDRLAALDEDMDAWLAGVVRCMHEKGWGDVDAMSGGYSFDGVPRAQQGALNDDLTACETDAGPAPNEEPLSRAEVAVIYERWVDAKTCLEGLGYEISEPPSRNVFIEDYLHSSGGPWSPFADLPASADLGAVKQTCPE